MKRKYMEEKCKIQEFQNRKLLLLLQVRVTFKIIHITHNSTQEYETQMSVYGVQPVKTEEFPQVKETLEEEKAPKLQKSIKEVTITLYFHSLTNYKYVFFRSSLILLLPNMKLDIFMRMTTCVCLSAIPCFPPFLQCFNFLPHPPLCPL